MAPVACKHSTPFETLSSVTLISHPILSSPPSPYQLIKRQRFSGQPKTALVQNGVGSGTSAFAVMTSRSRLAATGPDTDLLPSDGDVRLWAVSRQSAARRTTKESRPSANVRIADVRLARSTALRLSLAFIPSNRRFRRGAVACVSPCATTRILAAKSIRPPPKTRTIARAAQQRLMR